MATLDLAPFAPLVGIDGFTLKDGTSVSTQFAESFLVGLVGLNIPPGERLLTIGPWEVVFDVTSAADTAVVEISTITSNWSVSADTCPVASNPGQNHFVVGASTFSPPTGPGMPLGPTVVTVTAPIGFDYEDDINDNQLFSQDLFTKVAEGRTSAPDLSGSAAADIDITSDLLDYTTEPDLALDVWHAIVPADNYQVTTDASTDWHFPHDGSNGPTPPPADYATSKLASIVLEVEVISNDPAATSAAVFRVRPSITGPSGSGGGFGFEAVPDDPLVKAWARGPGAFTEWGEIIFQDPGPDTFTASDGPVEIQFPFHARTPINEPDLLAMVEDLAHLPKNYNGTWRINLLDVWYDRGYEPPVPGPGRWHVGRVGVA